ncbi:GDP-mannose 4,6-dehydratase [Streptomyces sp. SM1]|uniref:GDP-mannose 4,6-dehydratase n=1 Tax=Streptomyces sp. SM1 TaxID=402229 RepID=UPI000CD5A9E6|nr:GDP-mannose 4,6-dehydratase [Streptomyces sp. SM1]
MSTVVTGAAGFIGSWLCALLRSQGENVREIDLPHCDIGDTAHLTRVLERAAPERIYHLAAQASVRRSWQHPAHTWRTNAGGTVSLLEAARVACPGTKVLVMSSAGVFDGAHVDAPLTENYQPAPLSPYAASKLAAESAARHYFAAHALRMVVVRPFNVIGPGQSQEYLIPSLSHRLAAAVRSDHSRITVGNLEARRDFLDVRDAVRGLWLLMRDGQPGEVYHLCTGVGTPIRTLVETMISLTGRPLAYRQDPALARGADAHSLIGDPVKTRWLTGWQATVPLATTLADVLAEVGGPGPLGTRADVLRLR